MRINNNIMAMNTHRQYSINTNSVSKSTEKLSSGYRINRAGDDAAGLAISEKMRAQIRGLTMASKNSNDAISMVQTAEGALQESHNILQRMRELAVQSASDTNETTIDRAALDMEFQQLVAELDETARTTRFNDQNLIDGTFQKSQAVIQNVAGNLAKSRLSADMTMVTGGTYTMRAAYTKAINDFAGVNASNATGDITNLLDNNPVSEITVNALGAGFTDNGDEVTMTAIEKTNDGGLKMTFTKADASASTASDEIFTVEITSDQIRQAAVAGGVISGGAIVAGGGSVSMTISQGATADSIYEQLNTKFLNQTMEVDTNDAKMTFSKSIYAAANGFTIGTAATGSDVLNGSYNLSVTKDTVADRAIFTLTDAAGKKYETSVDIAALNIGAGATGNITLDFGTEFGTLALNLKNTDEANALTDANLQTVINDWSRDLGASTHIEIGGGRAQQQATVATPGEVDLTLNGETIRLRDGDTELQFNGITYKLTEAFDRSKHASSLEAMNKFLGTLTDTETADTANMSFTFDIELINGTDFVAQTGANQGDELSINIDKMDATFLGVNVSNVATREAASLAITQVNDAINAVSTQRAALGALQNRLSHKIANLDTSAENLQAAESRIRDLDMAKEMTNFTRNNILVQASTAMLAQANAAPQGVLQLLG